MFCKSLLQLHDFISSKLNKGIFSIITVTKQTTDVSAFRRAKVSGRAWKDTAGTWGFTWVASLCRWVASWKEAGRCWGGGEAGPCQSLPSQNVSSIGANPLKSINTPCLLVHSLSKQLWKLAKTSSGQYFWDSLMVQSKVPSVSLSRLPSLAVRLPPEMPLGGAWCSAPL